VQPLAIQNAMPGVSSAASQRSGLLTLDLIFAAQSLQATLAGTGVLAAIAAGPQ
jgi:hypothetical protein